MWAIFRGAAEILFLRGAPAGLVLAGVTLVDPNLALAGWLAVLAAWLASRAIGMHGVFLAYGFYVYNALLAGLAVGYLLEPGWWLVLLATLTGATTLATTVLLANWLSTGHGLSVLSLPFAAVSTLMYAAAARWPELPFAAQHNTALASIEFGLPWHVVALLRSLGSIVFMPSVPVGLVLAVLLAGRSRILFALAVLGFYAGALWQGALAGSLAQGFHAPGNFNYLLIAMAVGGVFLVPSLASTLVALAAVAASTLVIETAGRLTGLVGAPPFTWPFCLVTLSTVYVLRIVNCPLLAGGIGGTPEEVREHSLACRARYRGSWRTLRLPFSGQWTVWQGFDGRWTHQGIWRYGYDFLVTDEHGRTHRGAGERLEDYYCYRMPVLAPVEGRVVKIVDSLSDNSIGRVDGGNNWGNLIILHDPRGFYVEISHFAHKSFRVQEGDWVQRGMVLGLCGNSGYSPQPHIHIQVQATDALGAATLPFSFVGYQSGPRYYANDLPTDCAVVEPLLIDKRVDDTTTFLLDQVHQFDVSRGGREIGRLKTRVSIAADGTYCLSSERGRLYFGKHEGTLYLYRVEGDDPWLGKLLVALPRLPLAYRPGLEWHDFVPASLATSGGRRVVARWMAFVWPSRATLKVVHAYRSAHVIESTLESKFLSLRQQARVELDPQGGFLEVRVGDVVLRRAAAVAASEPAASVQPFFAEKRSRAMAACGMICVLSVAAALGAAQTSPRPGKMQVAIHSAVRLERTRNYAEAIKVLARQQRVYANDYTVNLRLGWLYYLSGQYADSERHYRLAMRAAPKSLEAKLGGLLPLLAASRFSQAETLAREIVKIDPGNYYGNLRLAAALRMEHKLDDARKVVAPVLKAYPSDVSLAAEMKLLAGRQPVTTVGTSSTQDTARAAAIQASLAYEYKLDYGPAIDVLDAVYAEQARDYTLNLRLGWLNYLKGQYREAASYYQTAAQTTADSREAQLGYVLVMLAAKDYAQAEAAARQVLAADPVNYYGNLRLAVALRLAGKLPEAERQLDNMLAYYPADVSFLTELALVKRAEKENTAADRLFYDVLALDPSNVTAAAQVKPY